MLGASGCQHPNHYQPKQLQRVAGSPHLSMPWGCLRSARLNNKPMATLPRIALSVTTLFLVTLALNTSALAADPAPQDSGPKIGYENFPAPGVLVPVRTSEGGQQPNSVEWMGRNAGEA